MNKGCSLHLERNFESAKNTTWHGKEFEGAKNTAWHGKDFEQKTEREEETWLKVHISRFLHPRLRNDGIWITHGQCGTD